jgi:acyl-[acyl-carrier-protein]-phospholipid O-acyltransferase/long-chain-fatty-acid--[acyl-carrier-protein] ligase
MQRLSRGFAWLNAAQFLGALNDNASKLLVIFFLVAAFGDEAGRPRVVASATALFVLPFLLFSNAAGVLADRLSKQRILLFCKFLEVGITAGCLAAVLWRVESLAYGVVFLMGCHSALFSPSKYGIVPELVPAEQLSWANSMLAMATYLAIIVGTVLPSLLLEDFFLNGRFDYLSVFCIGVALAGVLLAARIPRTPPAGTPGRISPLFFVEIARTVKGVSGDRDLLAALYGSAYFMFAGAFIQQNVLLYGQDQLGLSWIRSGYLFPVAALGIGVGAVVAGRVSGRNIELGVVPAGALLLAVGCIALGAAPAALAAVLAWFFVLGVGAGLYLVPLMAFIQYRAPAPQRGRIIAAESFLGFLGVAVSAGVFYLMTGVLGLGPASCFLALGVLTGLLAVASMAAMPGFLVRFVAVILTRLVYRVRTVNGAVVPAGGPALLVANHVTRVDPLLITATVQRRVRFVASREVFRVRALAPVLRLMGVIPVAPQDGRDAARAALEEARRALRDGHVVCVFAEGALTRNGNMMRFHDGWAQMVRDVHCPVIPVHIGGAWGSMFSHCRGGFVSVGPRRIPCPVDVIYGEPLPASAVTTAGLRQAVSLLSAGHFEARKDPGRALGPVLVRASRRFWFRPAVADSTGRRLTHGGVLVASAALARRIEAVAGDARHVGVILPASVGAVLVNTAVSLLGRVPVNLNFTVSPEALASAVNLAEIRTIVTSRAFMAKVKGRWCRMSASRNACSGRSARWIRCCR